MRTLVGERDERAARTAANAINEQLDHRAAAVQHISLRTIENNSLSEVLASSAFIDPDFDYGLAFLSPTGDLLESSGDPAFWNELLHENHEIINDYLVSAHERLTYLPLLNHPLQDETVILIATSPRPGSVTVVGAFSPASIASSSLTNAVNPGEQAKAYLVSPERKILYHIGDLDTRENLNDHPGIQKGLRGESGTDYVQVGGSEHVIAYSPVTSTGWTLVIEEPWEAVTNPLLNTTQLAPLVLVPVLIFALVALWFGARQIIQPLQSLEARAADLAWGNYQAIEESVGGIEEIGRLQRTLVHLAHKIQSAQNSLHSYIGAITQGQEEERRRLARELHDDTIQNIIALNQRIQIAQLSIEDDKTAEQISEIQDMTEETIRDLRRITQALRPLYLEDLGLVTSLNMLAKETGQSSGMPVFFNLYGDEQRLSPEIEIALYRMVQEGLFNIVKHSHAKIGFLEMHFSQDEVKLIINDDGLGFVVPESPGEFAPSGHFGLLGLYERADLIGANLGIHSSQGEGTKITIIIPIEDKDHRST